MVDPGNALSLAPLLHMCILRASIQAICIIAYACSLFSTVLSVDLRRLVTLSARASPCLLLKLLRALNPKMPREFVGLAASLTWLPLLGRRLAS